MGAHSSAESLMATVWPEKCERCGAPVSNDRLCRKCIRDLYGKGGR